ncbi:transporter substrate-binding domain-containing protein (plasmid) [Kovacikia minuta CCNUW1]|uniref:transporter substrate-binding domain-containing protein n=1 Tax=Kovacikia minuta TaxID=2931930 RepID=UPI001CCB5459|nr:transporter substrate-binding domain-containing protein [Kovacikia minuta]UBF30003.1 transporter substrate-binding domain-containing protein [Kovacikia minuta CCNUW1]
MNVSPWWILTAKRCLNSGLSRKNERPQLSSIYNRAPSRANFGQRITGGAIAIVLLAALPAHSQAPLSTPTAPSSPSPKPALTPNRPQALRVAIRLIKPDMFQENGQMVGFSVDMGRQILAQIQRQAVLKTYPDVPEILNAIRLGQADLGVMAIAITSQREKEFDFSHPILAEGLQIMVRAPSEQFRPVEQEIAERLLDPNLLRLFGIISLLMLIPAHILWYFERQNKDGLIENSSYIPGIFQALWWTILALIGQDVTMPRGSLGKLVGLFWFFIGIVFVAYFTAAITAELTVQELQGNIRQLRDLQNRPVAIITDSTILGYLQKQYISEVTEFPEPEQAYQALLDGKVDAFIAPAPLLLYYASQENKGKVRIVGTPFREQFYAIVMPKNSPYRKPINQAILTLKENGTYQAIYQKWFGVNLQE